MAGWPTCTNCAAKPSAVQSGGRTTWAPLLNHLDRRARSFRARTGVSPFEAGSIEELYRIRELAPQLRPRLHTVLAQPGLSASACTEEHLRLLAGAETYVHALTRGTFTVYCSA